MSDRYRTLRPADIAVVEDLIRDQIANVWTDLAAMLSTIDADTLADVILSTIGSVPHYDHRHIILLVGMSPDERLALTKSIVADYIEGGAA